MMQIYRSNNSAKQIAYHCKKIGLVALFFLASLSTWAQTKTVQIDDNRISIEQALQKIEQQTGYLFVLEKSSINVSKRIELPRTRINLNEMLGIILKDTGYGYKFRGKNIVIVKLQELQQTSDPSITPVDTPYIPIATQTIKGVVIDDETGRPLMGAKVSLSGVLGKDTETDHAGQFTIAKVPEGIQRIRTYLDGYYLSERGVQVSSTNSDEIKISLKTTAINLGSIRSDADKGGIVTAETSADAANAIAPIFSSSKDSVAVEIPILETYESPITSPYLNGVDYRDTKFGIKTNLLYLATMSPNIGIEWAMGSKWTAEVTAGFTKFKWGENVSLNHWLVKPEVKYWFCRAFDGHFFGVHGLVGQFRVSALPFNIPWRFDQGFEKGHAYQGWAYGVGVTYGYQWAIAKRLNFEASVGLGYVRFDYDNYSLQEDCKSCNGHRTRDYFGPTKAGLSLIYTFK